MATELQHVRGLSALQDRLMALPPELASKNGGPVRRGLRKAAVVVRDEARVLVPVASGLLKEELVVMRARNPKREGMTEIFRIGVRQKKFRYGNTRRNRRAGKVGKEYRQDGDAFYWRFVELGTVRLAPRPFLRPAFEARKREALEVFTAELAKGIRAAERNLAKRGRA
jgi:HK97 gp10 family phage protein